MNMQDYRAKIRQGGRSGSLDQHSRSNFEIDLHQRPTIVKIDGGEVQKHAQPTSSSRMCMSPFRRRASAVVMKHAPPRMAIAKYCCHGHCCRARRPVTNGANATATRISCPTSCWLRSKSAHHPLPANDSLPLDGFVGFDSSYIRDHCGFVPGGF